MSRFPFQRLQSELAELIARTPPGGRLPSEPELAKLLGVSRATLREAMRTFETQGLIRRRQGSGTYVVGRVSVFESGLEVLESLETLARRMGLSLRVSDLVVERVFANQELADIFASPLAMPLTRVRRVMWTEERPVAYLVDMLPEEVLKAEQLPDDFGGSVLDFLLDRGDPLTVARAAISAIGAPPDVAKALQIQRGDVLLHFTSRLYDTSGRVVDYALSYFIPGYFHFHVVRRVVANSR
ncbi:MAG: GntR family transcriptional regulator [Anaerolineae bacterium]|nr:MAG: GntR family transcriptional regulator [Anaerolineae bacterium]